MLTRCMARIDSAYERADPHEEAEVDIDLHVGVYEASHNVVLLHIMRALSGMLRKGVFHNREKLYARSEIRDVLRAQHRAIYDGIMAHDPVAAGEAAEDHMIYTRRVLNEIAADARLEISLRRLQGGNLSARDPEAAPHENALILTAGREERRGPFRSAPPCACTVRGQHHGQVTGRKA